MCATPIIRHHHHPPLPLPLPNTQDCHNIINDQDAVARSGKIATVFVRLLERPGHKILVNKRGEMLVQPSPMEAYMQLVMGFASWEDHLLSSYDQVRGK